MNDDQIKDKIEQVVNDLQGCKSVELVVQVATHLLSIGDLSAEIASLVDVCVAEGRIIEIEYVLPSWPHTIKSFYLPKGTEIKGK